MNIIVLQHIKIEDPGYIKDLMLADGYNLTTIELVTLHSEISKVQIQHSHLREDPIEK